MYRNAQILTIAFCLVTSCSKGSPGGGDMGSGGGDMGSGGGDMASGGSDMGSGGGDMASAGPPGLTLLAGQAGGPGDANRPGTDARFNGATSLGFDGAGNLFVADTITGIRKIDIATGAVTHLAPGGSNLWTVAADASGNVFFTDKLQHRIYQIAVATGSQTLLAGSGGPGYTDATGTAARFYQPSGMAADNLGNLYVADAFNHAIRKIVVATGQVTTLAGGMMAGAADGTGTAAQFSEPADVTWDGAGNLYVADNRNCTVRKIVVATAAVTTLAGTALSCGSNSGSGAAARFNTPVGVAADGAGNLYVADYNNQLIRKIVTATAGVITLAGAIGTAGNIDGTGAAARLNYPGAIRYDGAGNLFVQELYTVRKIVATTGQVTTFAGMASHFGSANGTGAAARFNSPRGLAGDGAGNVYVADTANHTIRKLVIATGVVTTLAGLAGVNGYIDGTGTSAVFSRPTGLTTDGAGNLYVADTGNSRIRKIVLATSVVTTLSSAFNQPSDVTWDGAGNLYVADTFYQTIDQLVVGSGSVTTLAGTNGAVGFADGPGTTARFNYPQGVLADGAGNLYVADAGNSRIRKIVIATRAVTTLLDGATAGGLAAMHHLALDGMGHLYVVDDTAVRKVDLATQTLSTVLGSQAPHQKGLLPGPLPGGLNYPWGLLWLPNQGLVVSDSQENVVLLGRGL